MTNKTADTNSGITFLDTVDVAKLLNCSLPTARQVMHRKDFPLIKVGKNLKVELQAFKNWSQQARL